MTYRHYSAGMDTLEFIDVPLPIHKAVIIEQFFDFYGHDMRTVTVEEHQILSACAACKLKVEFTNATRFLMIDKVYLCSKGLK